MVSSNDPVLAQAWRGPYPEALHHGAVVVTRADGSVAFAWGDTTSAYLPRSAIKPVQTVAMLRHGLDLDGAQLALASASHSGEQFHMDAACDVLGGAGLSPSDLRITPGLPLDPDALRVWVAGGHGEEPIAHNCSGKHAAMLRTCVRAGWDPQTYLDPGHPLQVAIRHVLSEFATEPISDPVVDGCGAPAFPMSLAGLARSFGRLASAEQGPERMVADSFRNHPEHASGTHRDEVVFHREVPGLVCKIGAEGTFAAGLSDGRGIAVKISDGAHRGTVPVLVAVLDAVGLGTDALRRLDPHPVLGHGRSVGRVVVDPGLVERLAAAF